MLNGDLVYLRATAGHLRTARGKLIVPVVALVESVIHAMNSPVPEFVPYSTLVAAPHEWIGKPVMLGHPTANGRQISAAEQHVLETHAFGQIQHARTEDRKLLMDIHIDEQKARRIGAGRLLERLRAGEQCEVSIGAFVRTTPEVGTFNGKRFEAVWTSLIPDHLALLEHQRGACSCQDGCGTYQRAAESYIPPDPYAPALAQLRAARRADDIFADQYRAARLAELEIEWRAAEEEHR